MTAILSKKQYVRIKSWKDVGISAEQEAVKFGNEIN